MSLLFRFRPLVINPELAVRVGLNEAIVLQQINYWIAETESGVDHDGKRWVYNTHEQWAKQFPFWSVDTVKRTLTSLHKQGLVLVEKLARAKHDQTNFYTINYLSPALFDQGNLPSSVGGILPSSLSAERPDVTETTTEITTETTQQTLSVTVSDVFDHWRLKMSSPRSKLDKPRRGLIERALKNYSAQDLKTAIDGCAASPFHMGVNDNKTKYNGLDLILRNAEKIDSFIGKAATPPIAPGKTGFAKDFSQTNYEGTPDDQFADIFK